MAHPSLPLHQPPEALSYWPNGGIEIIPNFFYLCHIGNKGAAWGILAGYGFWLSILAVLALIAIYCFRRQLALKQPAMQVSFGLLCGGILGNLTDRILYSHVVDFLDVHLPGYRWPAFNIADAGITAGLLLYLVMTMLEGDARQS